MLQSTEEVRRVRLINDLERLRAGGIAVLQAPSGSGKTNLLQQFAEHAQSGGAQVTWLDCTGLDSTVADDPEFQFAGALSPRSTAVRKPAVFLLDDVAPSDAPWVSRIIESLVRDCHASPRLFVASRCSLPLDVSDLRLSNRVVEYCASDLALDESELTELAGLFGVRPHALAPWRPQIEGWVEPCALLCRTLAGRERLTLDEFLHRCKALFGDRIIGELSPHALDFLARAAVPENLTISLVRQLTGVEAIDGVFRDLAARGVPIGRVGSTSPRWELHPLFRRYLLHLPGRAGIDNEKLHELSFRHFGMHGRIADALHHAVEAGHMDEAICLVESGGGWRLVMRGGSSELPRVLERVTAADVGHFPNAFLARIFYLAKCGQTAEARALLDGVMAGRASSDGSVGCDIQLVELHVGVYEDRAMDEADEARLHSVMAKIDANDTLARALALNHLCTITLHLGKFTLSQRYGEAAMRLYEEAGAHFGALHLHAHLGQMRLARGDLDGAEREYHLMAARASELPARSDELVAIAEALEAEVAYEMNSIARCEALLHRAMRTVERSDAWLDVLAATYRVATRLAYHESGLPGALSVLAHAERTAATREMPRLLRLIRVERTRVLTLSGELDEAGQELRRAGLATLIDAGAPDAQEADWAIRRGSTAVTLARYLVRSRRAAQALRVLDVAQETALDGGQLLAVAKLRVVLATALWQLRERPEAIVALCDAVRLLRKQAFRRFILDEGPPVCEILHAALDKGHLLGGLGNPLREKLAELSHLFAVDGRTGLSRQEAPFLERDRQSDTGGDPHSDPSSGKSSQHYLQLLAMGLSNKEIARVRGVSANTVKYHLKCIFRELHVDNRSRAVFRARELGIISG